MFSEGCFTSQHFSKSFKQSFLSQLAVGALDQLIKSTNHPITFWIYIWKLPFLKLSAGCFFNGDTKQFFVKINFNLFAKSENSSRLQHCDFRRQNYVFKYYGHQKKINKAPPPPPFWTQYELISYYKTVSGTQSVWMTSTGLTLSKLPASAVNTFSTLLSNQWNSNTDTSTFKYLNIYIFGNSIDILQCRHQFLYVTKKRERDQLRPFLLSGVCPSTSSRRSPGAWQCAPWRQPAVQRFDRPPC